MHRCHPYLGILVFLSALTPLSSTARASAPGGILEPLESEPTRSPSPQEIAESLPERGAFVFPPPYETVGVRLTNASDCAGDCVNYGGYSYWRNINNHQNDDEMLIFVGLKPSRGGSGVNLFSYNKITRAVERLGPLFAPNDPLSQNSGEGWYFSATLPTVLYITSGAQLLQYDVVAQTFETVIDVALEFGPGHRIWQTHSSDDDRVHSAILKDSSSRSLGCIVHDEHTQETTLYSPKGTFDECQIDRSGEWLVIKENIDGANKEDNRIIHLATGEETVLYDEQGAAGHSDLGYGYMIAEDDWASYPGAVRLWKFDDMSEGDLRFHSLDWSVDMGHVSHTNAHPTRPLERQYACSSHARVGQIPRSGEILCFTLAGDTKDVLVVAPVMTDTSAAGGGDGYAKMPKANLDITGRYVFWTSNMGGDRLDAFLAEVPGHLLVGDDGLANNNSSQDPSVPSGGNTSGAPKLASAAKAAGMGPQGCAGAIPALSGIALVGLLILWPRRRRNRWSLPLR